MKGKEATIGILGLIAVALVIVAAVQLRETSSLQRQLADSRRATAELEKKSQDIEQRLRAEWDEQKAQAERDKALLEETANTLKARLDQTEKAARDEKARLEKQIADLAAANTQTQAASANEAAAGTPEETSSATDAANTAENETASDDRATTSAADESPMKGIAKMMKNPAMRELVKSQQKTLMDMTYKNLYDSLNLDEETQVKLRDLLLDKQMKQMDLGLDMMDGAKTAEEKKAITDQFSASNAETDQAVKDLIGDKDYEFYKAYEDTKNERMQLNMFNQSLGDAGKLTTEQEDALTLAMFEARSSFKSINEMQNSSNPDPSQFTPEKIDGLLKDLKAVNEQYITRATPILNEEQLNLFKAYLKQQESMQEMGLRMAAKMFGGDSSSSGKTQPAATPEPAANP